MFVAGGLTPQAKRMLTIALAVQATMPKPVQAADEKSEYALLMKDVAALLHAEELRLSQEDEDRRYLLVMHDQGLWPIPFRRLDLLRDVYKFVRYEATEDDGISIQFADRDRAEYWLNQWHTRNREFKPK
jgi:hypothetical protein